MSHRKRSSWRSRLALRTAEQRRRRLQQRGRVLLVEALERRELLTVSIDDLHVLHPAAGSTLGLVANDPAVGGTVNGDFMSGSARVEFEQQANGMGGGSVEVYYPGQTLSFDPRSSDYSLYTYNGPFTLRYRATELDASGNVVQTGSWQSFSFTVDQEGGSGSGSGYGSGSGSGYGSGSGSGYGSGSGSGYGSGSGSGYGSGSDSFRRLAHQRRVGQRRCWATHEFGVRCRAGVCSVFRRRQKLPDADLAGAIFADFGGRGLRRGWFRTGCLACCGLRRVGADRGAGGGRD